MKKIMFFCILVMVVAGGCITASSRESSTTSVSSQATKLDNISTPTMMPIVLETSMPNYTLEGNCIVSQTPWEFEVGEGGKSIPILPNIPPLGWNIVSKMPDDLYNKIEGQGVKIISRVTNLSNNEIWFYTHSDVVLYRIETNEWVRGPVIHGNRLFATKDGEVWMFDGVRENQTTMLWRLDESKNSFDPVLDRSGILKSGEPGDVTYDTSGRFWFYVVDNYISTLYSFDPTTLNAQVYNFSGLNFSELIVDDQGNLYTMDGLDTLTRFTPATNAVNTVKIPTDYQSFFHSTSLYIDHNNWLWVSDRARFDLSRQRLNNWSIIVRSPIFIDNVAGYGENYWTRPEVQLESKDGQIWFRFTRGVVAFHPNTDQWCLVTTYPARVTEDSRRNLWMFIDGTLYERELSQ